MKTSNAITATVTPLRGRCDADGLPSQGGTSVYASNGGRGISRVSRGQFCAIWRHPVPDLRIAHVLWRDVPTLTEGCRCNHLQGAPATPYYLVPAGGVMTRPWPGVASPIGSGRVPDALAARPLDLGPDCRRRPAMWMLSPVQPRAAPKSLPLPLPREPHTVHRCGGLSPAGPRRHPSNRPECVTTSSLLHESQLAQLPRWDLIFYEHADDRR
jgi:hypothetical protein